MYFKPTFLPTINYEFQILILFKVICNKSDNTDTNKAYYVLSSSIGQNIIHLLSHMITIATFSLKAD